MTEITLRLSSVDELRRAIDALRPLSQEQEARIFQKFRLWWTYHSNAIEGNTLTLGETATFLMEGLTAQGKPLKDHLDIRGHHEAINYLIEIVRRKDVLTEAAIRELHKVLLVEPYWLPAESFDGQATRKLIRLGEYKSLPNHVRTPTGEIHFYARPEETPAQMGDLIAWLRDACARGERHVVEIAARFHHEFTAIHPFDDGNGRMSRLLMNLILMEAGYPPVVIRTGERDRYIFALSRADQGDAENFTLFIADHLTEAMQLYLRGARGEEISEPTDLEKEIALLKRELPPVAEAVRWNPASIQRVLTGVSRLFDFVAHHLAQIAELFARHAVKVQWIIRDPNMEAIDYDLDLQPGALFIDEKLLASPLYPLAGMRVVFTFFQLLQTPRHAFDVGGSIEVSFEDWSYTASLNLPDGSDLVSHDYHEDLSDGEVQRLGERFVRHYVEAIRRWTAGSA